MVAVISDIHGNLTALEAVLDDLERDRPDRVVCLGDVAATGPQPGETIERLRDLDCPTVMGNTDAGLLRPMSAAKTGEDARRIHEIDRWCAGQLSPPELDHLRGFAPTLEASLGHGRTMLCFHGSPRSFNDVVVATTSEDELERMFDGCRATVMAGGHTHEQFSRQHEDTILLNPGSVGLNPPWAEYALVSSETDGIKIELRRRAVSGDVVASAAVKSGMPHAEWWAETWGVGGTL